MRTSGALIELPRPAALSPGPSGDHLLAERLAAREPAALDEVIARYRGRCLALARRILVDQHLAEDVVQEVFLALWSSPGRYQPDRAPLLAWLMVLTRHKSIDRIRTRTCRSGLDTGVGALDTVPSAAPSPGDSAETNERAAKVVAALGQLPPKQREALALAYYGGYTQTEIATMTSTPLGTIKGRTLAGLKALAAVLIELDDAIAPRVA